jgi:hypothetical protein
MPHNAGVRRLGALLLLIAVCGVVGLTAYYGFVHRSVDGGRAAQVVYTAALLLPPALFLALALALLLRNATIPSVLGLVGVAVLVGAPTLVFFLGGLGIFLSALALILIGTASVAIVRRRSVVG